MNPSRERTIWEAILNHIGVRPITNPNWEWFIVGFTWFTSRNIYQLPGGF